jgi:aspartyl-tRNA(Asn)/glutamyl-tRNA(Gln) amidotransferase subunit C
VSVSAKDVAEVARLAELAVDDAELPVLTAQMDSIVNFVAQLAELEDLPGAGHFVAGPERTPLRDDVVSPAPLARPPSAIAPEFIDGFFVVPRLGAMEGT